MTPLSVTQAADDSSPAPYLSIVIPTLNEEASIGRCLHRVRAAAPGAQIIVSDGCSRDRTIAIARQAAEVVSGPAGRGRQLNLGVERARGEVLLFLHADTLLPGTAVEPFIRDALARTGALGGNFRVRFSPPSRDASVLEWCYQAVRGCGLFFGDSGIFVRREAFLRIGGFKQQEIMEDVELARWLRRSGKCCQLPLTVETSSRRFAGKTAQHMLLWTFLHVLYFSGVPEKVLSRFYPEAR